MIVLDICLSDIPQDKIKRASNGKEYVKFSISEMKQPDKWGTEYTVYMQQSKDERNEPRQYVGKGKEYGKKPQFTDFPDSL